MANPTQAQKQRCQVPKCPSRLIAYRYFRYDLKKSVFMYLWILTFSQYNRIVSYIMNKIVGGRIFPPMKNGYFHLNVHITVYYHQHTSKSLQIKFYLDSHYISWKIMDQVNLELSDWLFTKIVITFERIEL